MIKEGAVETPFYASIIGRHIVERCGFLAAEQVEEILVACDLELVGGKVKAKLGGPVNEVSAYRYKQAIKSLLGSGAYTMTKVNFRLAGCGCKDCRLGIG